MAATKTVYRSPHSLNSVPRPGVLTLFGYGIQVRVDRGHLVLEMELLLNVTVIVCPVLVTVYDV